jgi:hypothetical protein
VCRFLIGLCCVLLLLLTGRWLAALLLLSLLWPGCCCWASNSSSLTSALGLLSTAGKRVLLLLGALLLALQVLQVLLPKLHQQSASKHTPASSIRRGLQQQLPLTLLLLCRLSTCPHARPCLLLLSDGSRPL